MTGPEPTRASAAPGGQADSDPTRAGERRGLVTRDERRRLRASLGWELYSRRLARGWTQPELAERAGVSERHVRELARGQVRPSDRMCTLLARALNEGRDDLAVAVTDVRLPRGSRCGARPTSRRATATARPARTHTPADAGTCATSGGPRTGRSGAVLVSEPSPFAADDDVAVAFLLGHPELLDVVRAEHVDDGAGLCSACSAYVGGRVLCGWSSLALSAFAACGTPERSTRRHAPASRRPGAWRPSSSR